MLSKDGPTPSSCTDHADKIRIHAAKLKGRYGSKICMALLVVKQFAQSVGAIAIGNKFVVRSRYYFVHPPRLAAHSTYVRIDCSR